jgi:hypothetical protein
LVLVKLVQKDPERNSPGLLLRVCIQGAACVCSANEMIASNVSRRLALHHFENGAFELLQVSDDLKRGCAPAGSPWG